MRLLGYFYGKRFGPKIDCSNRKSEGRVGACPSAEYNFILVTFPDADPPPQPLRACVTYKNGENLFFIITPSMKMGQTECPEMSAYKIQTPGN